MINGDYFQLTPLEELSKSDYGLKKETLLKFDIDLIAEEISIITSRKLRWNRFDGWERLDDVEIFDKIMSNSAAFDGKTLVITEGSYGRKRSAVEIDGSSLRQFVGDHLQMFGECFFDGDVIVTSERLNMVLLFHHEGVFSLFATRQS